MIILLCVYIVFQILFDHWGTDTVTSKVIYFSFQYGWVGAVALYQATLKKNILFYIIFAIIMFTIASIEFTYIGTSEKTYAMMSASPPAFLLTCFAAILFIIFEIIMRWKRRLNIHGRNY